MGDHFRPLRVELLISLIFLVPHHALVLQTEEHIVVHMALIGVNAAQVLQEEVSLGELHHMRVVI